MPVTSTVMTLPAMYSKLSKSPMTWLPKIPPNNLILPPQCVQQEVQKISCSLHNHVPTSTVQDKQVLEDLKTVIKTRLDIQFTDLDNQDSLSLG
jgi:hypothetical protein